MQWKGTVWGSRQGRRQRHEGSRPAHLGRGKEERPCEQRAPERKATHDAVAAVVVVADDDDDGESEGGGSCEQPEDFRGS